MRKSSAWRRSPLPAFTAKSWTRFANSTSRSRSTRRQTKSIRRFRSNRTRKNSAYDPEYANRFWRVLLQSDRVFKEFRAGFCGKCSPVHFFWGSFDLAVTRFSGRRAPPHPGGVPHLPDAVAREAYSHEVSSLGFWPGNEMMPEPIFYSYAYPAAEGISGRESPTGGRDLQRSAQGIRASL